MRESPMYQEILEEGRQEALNQLRSKLEVIALNMLREGLGVELVARVTELSLPLVEALQRVVEVEKQERGMAE